MHRHFMNECCPGPGKFIFCLFAGMRNRLPNWKNEKSRVFSNAFLTCDDSKIALHDLPAIAQKHGAHIEIVDF